MPRLLGVTISELMIVAVIGLSVSEGLLIIYRLADSPIVMNPPPPIPARARIKMSIMILLLSPHPRQPSENVMEATRKQILRPKILQKRPYSGCIAVLVSMYEIVIQDARLTAWNSEPMVA